MQGPNTGEQLYKSANNFDPLNPWAGIISPGSMQPEDSPIPIFNPIEYCNFSLILGDDDMLWKSYIANPKFKEEGKVIYNVEPELEFAQIIPINPHDLVQHAWTLQGIQPVGPFCNIPGNEPREI